MIMASPDITVVPTDLHHRSSVVQENEYVLVKRVFDEAFRLVRAERES